MTVSQAIEGSSRQCESCRAELPLSLLACPTCGTLVHSATLKALAREGTRFQEEGDHARALATWRQALELLPGDTQQHKKVLAKIQSLSALVPASREVTADASPAPEGKHRARTGGAVAGLGALGLVLFKFKGIALFLLGKGKLLLLGLTQAKTFLSMALAAGVYTAAFGWWFALGLVVSIYIHEMGHVAWLRRYGIAASAPMFIPGLGAFIRLKQHPATVAEDARVGLAGPVWGAGAAVAALIGGSLLGLPILTAVGRIGAWINLFNLLPVWQLDGGRAFAALTRRDRGVVAVVLWALAFIGADGVLFLLAIAATARAGLKSAATPTEGDRGVLFTYLALVLGLTVLMSLGAQAHSLG